MLKEKTSIMKNQTGETIVEVLLALSVIGLALGISAVVVSRSAAIIQTTKEQSAALGVVQGQVERVREYISDNPEQLTDSTSTIRTSEFCMTTDADPELRLYSESNCRWIDGGARYIFKTKPITKSGAGYLVNTSVEFLTVSGDTRTLPMLYRIYP